MVLDGDGARPDGVEQRAVVRHEQQRAGERLQRVLQRLAALEVQVVGRLVEDQHVGAAADEDREPEALALAAAEPVERLLDLVAGEEEAAEQRARLVRCQPRALARGLDHRARPAELELLAVLGEVADHHVVPGLQPALGERRLARERADQGGLAGAVGSDERDVLAALEPQLGLVQQRPRRRGIADLEAAVLELEDHAARALGLLELEAQVARVARVARDPPGLELAQLLDAVLRLVGLRRLRREALDEPLHARDLRLLAGDRLAERQLARRLLPAPCVPRSLEEARATGLDLEHAGSDGLEEPAVVRDQDDRRVEADERLLEPFERLDVEVVGRLVEQQQRRARRQHARQRSARQLAAGERRQRPVEVGVDEAEAVHDVRDALAPGVAADRLEARLDAGVLLDRALVALAHLLFEHGELRLELDRLAAAGQHVVAQRQVALTRRALVVQRDPRALLEHQLAAVDRRLPGEHPQQRRLPGAVAAGDRHAIAALELERDAAQERFADHVLGEI